jgi:cyclopropane-fatty-acyl-phospholipid synthase
MGSVGVLQKYLQRTIQYGCLRVRIGQGPVQVFGDGTGPEISVLLTPGAALKIALSPNLKLGECFMEGELRFEAGDMYALLELAARNNKVWKRDRRLFTRLHGAMLRHLTQINGRQASRRNVAHHYDLSQDLYRRFLDSDMQYSCAYFRSPEDSLEEAQIAKKAHIAAKLGVQPGDRVLDIGCGWGGLGLTLGGLGADVLGVTLSQEQLAVARRRAAASRMDHHVDFQLRDYRDLDGQFDRIVSVGMFEHVGKPNYQAYFDTVARLLSDDGVALIHSIGRRTPPGVTQPFIAKYIFPGGYIPALSEVVPAIEKAGLWITDIEILRLHYAETLREWRRRFEAQRAEIAEIYDERFCRMWEFYLISSEAGFRWFGMMNFQLQLTKRVDALPMTRDYMLAGERDMLAGEAQLQARRTAAE